MAPHRGCRVQLYRSWSNYTLEEGLSHWSIAIFVFITSILGQISKKCLVLLKVFYDIFQQDRDALRSGCLFLICPEVLPGVGTLLFHLEQNPGSSPVLESPAPSNLCQPIHREMMPSPAEFPSCRPPVVSKLCQSLFCQGPQGSSHVST